MRQLTGTDLESFVAARPAAAIHFDAEWDVGHRPTVRARMLEAEKVLNEQANFGEVDVDQNQELAKTLQLLNVPAVAYYRDGKLVAILLGARQNIRARLERVLRGETIGPKDGTEESS
jgi:Thioredoxin